MRCESKSLSVSGCIRDWRWQLHVSEDVFSNDAVDHVCGSCVEASVCVGGWRCGVRSGGTSEERWGYNVVVGVILNDGRQVSLAGRWTCG